MKIRILTFLLLCGAASSLFGQLQLGAGIASGTGDLYPFGVFGRVGYGFGEKFVLAATAQTFFPEDAGDAVSTSLWQYYLDGQYTVLDNDWLSAYGLLSIGYSQFRSEVDLPGIGGGDFTARELFFGLGAGVNYKVGETIVPFGEVRLPILDGDVRLLVNLGVMFRL